ncbi:hypothetical protein LguiB_011706 [Lonicera macranthoides]
MARGLIITSHFVLNSSSSSISRFSSQAKCKYTNIPPLSSSNHLHFSPSTRCFCCCCQYPQTDPVELSKYRETFFKRMTVSGLKPHHRIAMGVSGGPDSMALCVLAADWKTNGLNAATKQSSEFIDGLLAIVVDHGLRIESKDEANLVRRRVLNMGIRCEIAGCEWSDGKPKQGHLQEAARTARYQNFQRVCFEHQISALLVAHHADDQAELFILRLSRNSGVLGLAGMAFTSQLFSTFPSYNGKASNGVLLVRPLLEFSKEDMYKICIEGKQEWVEDPTNRSTLFARNRIRISLKNLSSSIFRSELQAVISACRRTRSHVDRICHNLINQAVTIMPHGYAVIDLEILSPSKIKDIYLSKFIALLLQFVSQRQRPVRGSAMKLLLDYIRIFPCKTSLTAASCYLCAAPGSKGTKILVCCCVGSSLPSEMELLQSSCSSYSEQNIFAPCELEQIIANGKSSSNQIILNGSEAQFLDATSSEYVLIEAKRLNILSESTHKSILSLRGDELEQFKPKPEFLSDREVKNEMHSVNTLFNKTLRPGQVGYFMNRFFVTWRICKKIVGDTNTVELGLDGHDYCCIAGFAGDEMVAEVRHVVEADWLYLAELAKCQNEKGSLECSYYARLSAQKALLSMKSIPVAARRALPILVNPQGLILSIPSVCFSHCPCLEVSAVFRPRVPLGGGHSSFL